MTTGPFMRNGAPPPGWGEVETLPTVDTGGHRLAADALATRILAGLVAHADRAGVPLPERRYVAAGIPNMVPWDCEQVTVAATGIAWGPAAQVGSEAALQVGTQTGVGAMRHIVFEVAIIRALPQGASLADDASPTAISLPDLDALDRAGQAHLRDMGLLSQALVEMFGPDPIKTIVQAGTHAQPGLVQSAGPEGNYAGVVSTLAVTLGETA